MLFLFRFSFSLKLLKLTDILSNYFVFFNIAMDDCCCNVFSYLLGTGFVEEEEKRKKQEEEAEKGGRV